MLAARCGGVALRAGVATREAPRSVVDLYVPKRSYVAGGGLPPPARPGGKGPLTPMQIRLTVLGPLGGQIAHACDVLVTAPAGTALAGVTSGLAAAVAAAGSDLGSGAVVVYAGAERLDPQRCALGEPPLIDGAVLSLGGPADPELHAGVPLSGLPEATARLHVISGPDAGGVHLLHGGEVRVGRSATADIPLDDPDVSRLHCAVTVAANGRVTLHDLGSTNGSTLGGTPVDDRPVPFRPGPLLRVGESALVLHGADEGVPRPLPTAPDGEGHLRVTPARPAVPTTTGQGTATLRTTSGGTALSGSGAPAPGPADTGRSATPHPASDGTAPTGNHGPATGRANTAPYPRSGAPTTAGAATHPTDTGTPAAHGTARHTPFGGATPTGSQDPATGPANTAPYPRSGAPVASGHTDPAAAQATAPQPGFTAPGQRGTTARPGDATTSHASPSATSPHHPHTASAAGQADNASGHTGPATPTAHGTTGPAPRPTGTGMSQGGPSASQGAAYRPEFGTPATPTAQQSADHPAGTGTGRTSPSATSPRYHAAPGQPGTTAYPPSGITSHADPAVPEGTAYDPGLGTHAAPGAPRSADRSTGAGTGHTNPSDAAPKHQHTDSAAHRTGNGQPGPTTPDATGRTTRPASTGMSRTSPSATSSQRPHTAPTALSQPPAGSATSVTGQATSQGAARRPGFNMPPAPGEMEPTAPPADTDAGRMGSQVAAHSAGFGAPQAPGTVPHHSMAPSQPGTAAHRAGGTTDDTGQGTPQGAQQRPEFGTRTAHGATGATAHPTGTGASHAGASGARPAAGAASIGTEHTDSAAAPGSGAPGAPTTPASRAGTGMGRRTESATPPQRPYTGSAAAGESSPAAPQSAVKHPEFGTMAGPGRPGPSNTARDHSSRAPAHGTGTASHAGFQAPTAPGQLDSSHTSEAGPAGHRPGDTTGYSDHAVPQGASARPAFGTQAAPGRPGTGDSTPAATAPHDPYTGCTAPNQPAPAAHPASATTAHRGSQAGAPSGVRGTGFGAPAVAQAGAGGGGGGPEAQGSAAASRRAPHPASSATADGQGTASHTAPAVPGRPRTGRATPAEPGLIPHPASPVPGEAEPAPQGASPRGGGEGVPRHTGNPSGTYAASQHRPSVSATVASAYTTGTTGTAHFGISAASETHGGRGGVLAGSADKASNKAGNKADEGGSADGNARNGEGGEDSAAPQREGGRRGRGIAAWARRLTGGRGGALRPGAVEPSPAEGGAAEPRVQVTAAELRDRWPDPAAVLLTALGPGPRLWERGPDHPDLLSVRLGSADRHLPGLPPGTGPLPCVPVAVGLREAGSLGLAGPRARLSGLARSVLAQLAALHSPAVLEYVLISADRSRSEEERQAEWSWLGWLPHLRPSAGQDCRLLVAYDQEQATARTAELVRRLDDGPLGPRWPVAGPAEVAAAAAAHQGPYTVLIVDGDPGTPALRETVARLAACGAAAGIHLVCLADAPATTPASPVSATLATAERGSPGFPHCGVVALLSGDVATAVQVIHRAPAGGPGTVIAALDAVSQPWAERFARALAPLRLAEGTDAYGPGARVAALPRTARLLDELGLARATPASLTARWAAAMDPGSRPGGRAVAVLGAGPHGPLAVDLAADGPHLLVEGGPGSGKTELLRALAASLAAADRPDRLSLVLVDGAAAERGEGLRVCTELPHVSTYLAAADPVRMREFAQALSSELKRRAELLGRLDFCAWHAQQPAPAPAANAAGTTKVVGPRRPPESATGDLDASSAGTLQLRTPRDGGTPAHTAENALPRLVVLVDDFDALVAPALGSTGRPAAGSVVRALEAVARDGERLGVHLIAASGRPERTADTAAVERAGLRATLEIAPPEVTPPTTDGADGSTGRPAPGRGRLHRPDDDAVTPFQSGRVTGRIPRTATLRPTVVPLDWRRMGDPPTRRPVRELGNGPTDLALLASALQRAAQSAGAQAAPPLL